MTIASSYSWVFLVGYTNHSHLLEQVDDFMFKFSRYVPFIDVIAIVGVLNN